MNNRELSAILALTLGLGMPLLLLPPNPASAAAYKCVDQNGATQYVDLPREGYTCTQLRTVPAPTPVNAESQAPATQAPETASSANDNANADDLRQKNCEVARANLATLQSTQDIVITDKAGNKTLLNAEQRQTELARTQTDINYWCS